MMAIPVRKSKPLATNLVVVSWTEAARAKIMAKKKITATAMVPNTVVIFMVYVLNGAAILTLLLALLEIFPFLK